MASGDGEDGGSESNLVTSTSNAVAGSLAHLANFASGLIGAILGTPLRSYGRELNNAKAPIFLGVSYIVLVALLLSVGTYVVTLHQGSHDTRMLEEGRLAESLSKRVLVELGGNRDDTRRVTAKGAVGDISFWMTLERTVGGTGANDSRTTSIDVGQRCDAAMPLATFDTSSDGQLSRSEAGRALTQSIPDTISTLPVALKCPWHMSGGGMCFQTAAGADGIVDAGDEYEVWLGCLLKDMPERCIDALCTGE